MILCSIMEKIDTRSLNRKAQQKNRNLAIKLRKGGLTYLSIAQNLGINKSTVQKWWKKYKIEGPSGILLKKRGVKPGTNTKLNCIQTQKVREILINNTPDEFNLPFCLWTRKAIQMLILDLWSIFIPLRTISNYMKRLGFTLQKPIKRAYEQNRKDVQKWINQEYPKISERAKKEKAEIHWVDETGLSCCSNYLRGFSSKG